MIAFAAVALMSACVLRADDDVLYWMLTGSEAMTDADGQQTTVSDFLTASGGTDFSARVRVKGGGLSEDTFLDLYYYDGEDFVLDSGYTDAAFFEDGGVWSCGLGDGNLSSIGAYSSTSPEYSFTIELGNVVNDEWTQTLATSSSVTYQQLADDGFIRQTFDLTPPVNTMWNGTSFTAVPEPSGGMLLMMGVALLALRRAGQKGE